MRASSIVCTMALVLASAAGARADPGADAAAGPNRIAFGLGAPHLQLRDELTRAFRWDGFGGLVTLGYERRSPSLRHAAGLELPAAWVTNRYDAGAAALALRLDYTLLLPVVELGGGRLWAGGRYRWDHALQYYVDWDEEHLYWLAAHELGPAALWERPLARSHALRASLSLPLIALASRPPAERTNKIDDLKSIGFLLGRPHEDMSFTSLHEYVSVEAAIGWDWTFSDSWLLQATWALRYRRHAAPKPVELLENSLVTGLAHEF